MQARNSTEITGYFYSKLTEKNTTKSEGNNSSFEIAGSPT